MRLWLYSISCKPILDYKKKNVYPKTIPDILSHSILLYCLDERCCEHIVRVTYYYTFIDVLLKKEESDRLDAKGFDYAELIEDLEKEIHKCNPDDKCLEYIQNIEARKVRLSVGYTASDTYVRLRIRLKKESNRQKVRFVLLKEHVIDGREDTEKRIGDVAIEQLLHSFVIPERQFLSEFRLQLGSWIQLNNCFEDRHVTPFYKKGVRPWSCPSNAIFPLKLQPNEPALNTPTLTRLYLRVEANSFTATKENQNNPSYSIPEDEVNCISVISSTQDRLALPKTFVLPKINDFSTESIADVEICENEEMLLRKFSEFLDTIHFQVIVFASDEKCCPTSLFYLLERAKRYENLQLGFSKLRAANLKCEIKKHNGRLELEHPGVERVDICQVLPKAQLSPNLDGFTLMDAARHKKLLYKEDKIFFAKIINLDYCPPTSLSHAKEVVADNKLNAMLLRAIEQTSNFTLAQQEVARMCYIDITSVVERGQQVRVSHLYFAFYTNADIVMNDQQTKKPYLVVNRKREDSSYPRPPYLENPKPDVMRNEERPGHVIREALPKRLEFLLEHEHNNKFEIPQKDQELFLKPELSSVFEMEATRRECDALAEELLQYSCRKTEQKQLDKMGVDEEEKTPEKKWYEGKKAKDFKPKSRKKIKTQEEKDAAIAYRGGCVLEALLNFYRLPEEAILTVDFASLYPSIMRAFRICYMRVVYDPKWLTRDDVELEYVPITETQCVVFVKRHLRDGQWVLVDDITPMIIEYIMSLRDSVRQEQKAFDPKSLEYQVLESRQLAAKTIANSTYGYKGSKTSPTPCTALAAAITQIGQWKIQTVRFIFLFFGHMAVYGDTDSNMIRFWVPPKFKTRDEIMTFIYNEGTKIVALNMKVCIFPNKLEPETFKTPYLLLGKKTYAAGHYKVRLGSWNKTEPNDFQGNTIKGMAAKKRDKCGFAQNIGCVLVNWLLDDPMVSFEALMKWFQDEIAKIPMGPITRIEDLNPFIITCSLSPEYKTENEAAVKALQLAQMTEVHVGARPRVNSRIAYVVTYKPKIKLQAQLCEIPAVFFARKSILNVEHILTNHVYNVVKQILSLPMHEPLLHMFETAIHCRIRAWKNIQNKTPEITKFFTQVPRTCDPKRKKNMRDE